MDKKKSATEIILTLLQKQTEITADLFDNFLCSYHESYRKIRGKMLGRIPRVKFDTDWAEIYHERQKFYSLLYALKKQGMIAQKKVGRTSKWNLTAKGGIKMVFLAQNDYKRIPTRFPIIVSYDIPEEKRSDRDWLRETLQMLGFKMVHKSLWIEKIMIPEELFQEMRTRKIVEHVHIIEIGKSGTIQELL